MGMLTGTASPANLATRADQALDRLEDVMSLVLEALDTRVEQICVTDQSPAPGLQKDFPTKGAQRVILERTPAGRSLEVKEALEDVLPANVNRLGGTVVNRGEKPVILWLAKASQKNEGSAPIYLNANGGSWDFRLGNLLWSGSVAVQSVGGNSQITICEV